jgi:hypothetical protein
VTEDEAKTKWCQFVRFSSGDQPAFNRGMVDPMNRIDLGNEYIPRCIGSACMAWRWDQSRIDRNEAGLTKIEAIRDYRAKHGSDLQTAKDAVERAWSEPKTEGFCGLAGAPR